MARDDYLTVRELPPLRNPFLVAAFAGWNDASQVATHALTTIVNTFSSEKVAEIDPEEFFDFSETRPTISLGSEGQRWLRWPSNALYGQRLEDGERDLLILIGNEPQLKWRTFCEIIIDLAGRAGASCLVTLGGLLADVPHTVEPRLTGFVSDVDTLPDLHTLGLRVSAYEGPTGIIGALHDLWRETGKPAISIWGNVPHYISAAPNPQISLALLRRLALLVGTPMPVENLERQEQAFRTQVDEALVQNPEAGEYVRQLEEHFSEDATPPPSGPELIAELEEFLRNRRPDAEA